MYERSPGWTAARRAATRLVGRLPRWRRARHVPEVVELERVRRRLEFLLGAMYGRTIAVHPAAAPPRRGWTAQLVRRIAGREPRHLRPGAALAASDGESVHLPVELPAADGEAAAIAHYRLLAFEQAERIARGTAALVPGADAPVERDLYLLAEAAAVDAALTRTARTLLPELARARAAALAERPAMVVLTPAEQEVERVVQMVLAADPGEVPPGVGVDGTAGDSLRWARETAARLHRPRSRYRRLPPVALWGGVLPVATDAPRPVSALVDTSAPDAGPPAPGLPARGGRTRARQPDEHGEPGDQRGVSAAQPGPDQETVEHPQGRPTLVAAPGGAPDASGADWPDDAPWTAPPTGVADAVSGGVPALDAAAGTPATRGVLHYPEWDCLAGRYRPRAVIVRQLPPAEGDPAWATDVLAQHAVVVRRVRQQFDKLRAHRTRLSQQRDGDELDVAACVRSLVDRRTGHTGDDRLYVAVRPARRGIAIALLVDVSGSTDALVSGSLQVIDVEKIALLLASEALDALGDPYTILTFSSRRADDVRLTTIKDFGERNGDRVRRRVSALAPAGNTRLGAAVRHVAGLLARQPAGHRLLLILSDGRPNDIDHYQGRYALEDSRQAILEARAADVYPFCLTVDREGPDYLARVFGAAGHTVLRRPDQLPLALLGVVRQLLGS